jgi:hypothetical protein
MHKEGLPWERFIEHSAEPQSNQLPGSCDRKIWNAPHWTVYTPVVAQDERSGLQIARFYFITDRRVRVDGSSPYPSLRPL